MRPILRLTRTQQQIYDLVGKQPRTARELRWLIWDVQFGDAPDTSCIKAHVYEINKKICYRGECIRATRDERRRFKLPYKYSLVKVKAHAYSKRKPARDQNAAGLEGTQSAGQASQH